MNNLEKMEFFKTHKINEKEVTRRMKEESLSRGEAISSYLYDTYYCNSDADAKWFLENVENLSSTTIENMFTRIAAKPAIKVVTVSKEVTAKTKDSQTARLNYLRDEIAARYKDLFGDLVSEDNTSLNYVEPDTNVAMTIKISKHKVQKVMASSIIDDRKDLFTDVQVKRFDAILDIMNGNHVLFENVTEAGSQFGYSIQNLKYSFGSIKITRHSGHKTKHATVED